jgi:competence protein ComEC
VNRLWLGEPEKYHSAINSQAGNSQPLLNPPVTNCHQVSPWQWDQVTFRFITWPVVAAAKANNHSCVLLVEYEGHKILLTGDIEKEVEQTLLASESLMPVEVLLAPHHGSHTSSTAEFVAQTQPRYVIYSAGYHNQHGHPHNDVQARYRAINAHPLNTAFSGALEFNWDNGKLQIPGEYRQLQKRYWFSDELENAGDAKNKAL